MHSKNKSLNSKLIILATDDDGITAPGLRALVDVMQEIGEVIVVAPVKHWKFYDSNYTERYMHTPKENEKGFTAGSPLTYVDNLKGKLMLHHGTADDNVHLQNSLELVSSLVKAGKQFDTFFYPNKNHNISGGNTHFHLYTQMTDFIIENL